MSPPQKLCGSHQEGGRPSGAEDGAAPEALRLSPVPETAGLCIPHGHPCSLPSAESRSQEGSRRHLCHKPLRPGRPPCSHQEGGRLSGAEDGAASEALCISPGRWPVVWRRRWRRPRSSATLTRPRNGWPLYSTPSPVQPDLQGVLEPRWLRPEPEAETSRAGQTPVLSPGRWPVVSISFFTSNYYAN